MSDPFSQLQADVAARLTASEYLATIPMIVEELGSITDRIAKSLARSGVKTGDTNLAGLALLILTPKGRSADSIVTQSQMTTVRVSVFCKPLLNSGASGHQKPPLEVLFGIIKQLLTWERGAGRFKPRLIAWDSAETDEELTYFADFEVPHVLNLT